MKTITAIKFAALIAAATVATGCSTVSDVIDYSHSVAAKHADEPGYTEELMYGHPNFRYHGNFGFIAPVDGQLSVD